MMIELVEMFLGAFNYFVSDEYANYQYFQCILIVGVCLIMFVTASVVTVVLCKGVLDIVKRCFDK